MSIFLIYFENFSENSNKKNSSELYSAKLPSQFISLPVKLQFNNNSIQGIAIYDGVASDRLLFLKNRKVKYNRSQKKAFIDFIRSRITAERHPSFIFIAVSGYLDRIQLNPKNIRIVPIEKLSRQWYKIELNEIIQILLE